MIDTRTLRTVVLAVWAGFFAYLWLSGEVSRYLGPRTYWVVPFGALTLGAAAVVHGLGARGPVGSRPARRGDLVGAAIMLVPVLAVAIVPHARLGALAASRKATGAAVSAAGLAAAPLPAPGEEPSFIDVHFANESRDYAAQRGITEGTGITLAGFVSSVSSEGFDLTRFYVSCCAADAIPYSVTVLPSNEVALPKENRWLRVRGALHDTPDGFVLEASSIEAIAEPDDPYLY